MATIDEIKKQFVDRFLAWPLPKSVRSDLCVTMDYPHSRSGTNLLTADEAGQLFDDVVSNLTEARGQPREPWPTCPHCAAHMNGTMTYRCPNGHRYDGASVLPSPAGE